MISAHPPKSLIWISLSTQIFFKKNLPDFAKRAVRTISIWGLSWYIGILDWVYIYITSKQLKSGQLGIFPVTSQFMINFIQVNVGRTIP